MSVCGGEQDQVWTAFKKWLEDDTAKKVWHHYSFDRHMLANEEVQVRGFWADTMHMARLWDSSRALQGGYSLASLSQELLGWGKTSMLEIFGKSETLKSGKLSAKKTLPDPKDIQSGDVETFHRSLYH